MEQLVHDATKPATLADVFTCVQERRSILAEVLREAIEQQGNPDKLRELLDRLEQTVPTAKPNTAIALKPSDMCNLGVAQTALGTECSFTIPKGMSGKAVLALIERANPRAEGDGVVCPNSKLLAGRGLDDVAKNDIRCTFTVCARTDDYNRSRQGSYLIDHDLKWTDRVVLTLGAALFRDKMGFPENRSDIGTANDSGDLFKGKSVRARFGYLVSKAHGLQDDCGWDDPAHFNRLAAGSPRIKNLDN
jgi:hypothetical protein